MHEWYERTALTPMRVARATGYIDWSMQPSLFKHYPEGLFSYDLNEHDALKVIALSRCVTSEHTVGGKPYVRLNTPSAGNLHPLELYVQIRGTQGIISGIYHVDAGRQKLVLIREIESDGLENTLGMRNRFKGMIFVLSAVPFRSAWKYGERSWRYCFLDAGHQLGALQAAATACGREVTNLSGFDVECLDTMMGFSEQERSVAVILSGESTERECKPLTKNLMQVAPTDYFEKDDMLFDTYNATLLQNVHLPHNGYREIDELETLIHTRRSARGFDGSPLAKEDLEHFLHLCSQPPQPLVCHTFVLRGDPGSIGLYEGDRLVRQGSYSSDIAVISVDQPFVSTSSLVLIFSASAFGAETLMSAAAFAHTLQLHSCARQLGSSGIGAFYDHKLQHFLKTDNYILYMMVIGHERDI